MDELKWQKEKPDFACVFLTKQNGEYEIWRFVWEHGEPPETANQEKIYYYLAWVKNEGDEWDEAEECDFDEYLVIEKLPTMEETHELWKHFLKEADHQ